MTSPPTPRVSVLLPCRDAAEWLDECIASLEAQTEARYEVLVIDDGSEDDTLERLVAWVERDPRVRPVDCDRRGLVPALNALAAAARAPVLARMDADDVAHPNRLAAQLALLDDDRGLAACGTGVRYFPRSRAGSGYRRYEAWINGLTSPEAISRDLFVECPIAHPTLMIRKHILQEVGGYREFEGPEDYDLILRLAAAGQRMSNVADVLLNWRLGPGRASERSSNYSAEAFRRLKVRYLTRHLATDPGASGRPLIVWGAGKVGKAFVRAWMSAGQEPFEALVDLDPRKIGQHIHHSPVIAPDTLQEQFAGLERRPFVLVAVGSPGAREEIRDALSRIGAQELTDFRAVA